MKANLDKELNDLIKGCRKNKRQAQELLYRKYYGLMMSIAMRYTKNYEDTCEVLNSGFLKIFMKIKDFKFEGSFEGWMKRIVVNTALDKLREYRIQLAPIESVNNYEAEIYIENDVIKKFDEKEIIELIQELPPMSRAVFNMYAIEGYKHKEIAEALDMQEGTSFWHLQNARKILKKKLEEKKVFTRKNEKQKTY